MSEAPPRHRLDVSMEQLQRLETREVKVEQVALREDQKRMAYLDGYENETVREKKEKRIKAMSDLQASRRAREAAKAQNAKKRKMVSPTSSPLNLWPNLNYDFRTTLTRHSLLGMMQMTHLSDINP